MACIVEFAWLQDTKPENWYPSGKSMWCEPFDMVYIHADALTSDAVQEGNLSKFIKFAILVQIVPMDRRPCMIYRYNKSHENMAFFWIDITGVFGVSWQG